MILILKTGSTIESIAKKRGDFEDWIVERMELKEGEYLIHPTGNYESPPPDAEYSGVIITGSPLMVTDLNLDSLWIRDWLLDKQTSGVPVLGICYGHQLLTAVNEGTVKNNDAGIIIGANTTQLTPGGKKDMLLGEFPEAFKVFKTHNQSVERVPPAAEVLAVDNTGVIDAIRFSEKCWGVQFHPEFDAQIMKHYIKNKKNTLADQGYNIDKMLDNADIVDYGGEILTRFKEIAHLR